MLYGAVYDRMFPALGFDMVLGRGQWSFAVIAYFVASFCRILSDLSF